MRSTVMSERSRVISCACGGVLPGVRQQAQPAAPLVFHASRFGTFTDRPVVDLARLERESSGPWD